MVAVRKIGSDKQQILTQDQIITHLKRNFKKKIDYDGFVPPVIKTPF